MNWAEKNYLSYRYLLEGNWMRDSSLYLQVSQVGDAPIHEVSIRHKIGSRQHKNDS